jgi:exosortase
MLTGVSRQIVAVLGRLAAAPACIVLLAFIPFGILYFRDLWTHYPHYQFAPPLVAVAVWLLWKRWPRSGVHVSALTRRAAWTMKWMGVAILAAAVVVFSPWLAIVGAMSALAGVLLLGSGRAFWSQVLPIWLLLWLVIRPPGQVDDLVMRTLQDVTARNTSLLLDWSGIHHIRAGNVFQLPGKELFVAEACSGVHSQLVLFAMAAIWLVVEQRGWLHAVLLLSAAVFWSIVMNTVRVTAVVYAAARYEIDLSVGWQHEVLGYGLVLAGFCLIVCTDRLLLGVAAPVLDYENALFHSDDSLEPENRLAHWWNRWISTSHRSAPSAADPCSAAWQQPKTDEPARQNLTRTRAASAVTERSTDLRWRRADKIIVAVAAGLALLQMSMVCLAPRDVRIDVSALPGRLGADSLPAVSGAWQKTDYQTRQREIRSDQGHFSHIWRYRSENQLADVSVDFPFLGWHELTRCYQARGWRVVHRTVQSSPAADAGDSFVEVELRKPTGEVGLLQFCLYDGAGRPVTPQRSHWKGIRGKLMTNPLVGLLQPGSPAVGMSQATLQVQQFVLGDAPLDNQLRQLTRRQFLHCRSELVKLCFPLISTEAR